ncbi:TPA: DUF2770 family protein, partial [Escherichia coli]
MRRLLHYLINNIRE